MITKVQALALRKAFIDSLPSRLDEAVMAAAQTGATGLDFPYLPASDVEAQTFVTSQAIPAGWSTSSVDTTNKLVLIRP